MVKGEGFQSRGRGFEFWHKMKCIWCGRPQKNNYIFVYFSLIQKSWSNCINKIYWQKRHPIKNYFELCLNIHLREEQSQLGTNMEVFVLKNIQKFNIREFNIRAGETGRKMTNRI